MTRNSISIKANDASLILFAALRNGTVKATKEDALDAIREIVRELLAIDCEKYNCEFTKREYSLVVAESRRMFNELQRIPAEYHKANTERGLARARQLGLHWVTSSTPTGIVSTGTKKVDEKDVHVIVNESYEVEVVASAMAAATLVANTYGCNCNEEGEELTAIDICKMVQSGSPVCLMGEGDSEWRYKIYKKTVK